MACTSSCCKWIHVLAFAEQVVWTAWRSSNNTMGTKPWSHCESKWCLVITVQSEFQTVMMTPACTPFCLHLCHMLFCVKLAVPHLPNIYLMCVKPKEQQWTTPADNITLIKLMSSCCSGRWTKSLCQSASDVLYVQENCAGIQEMSSDRILLIRGERMYRIL